MEIKTDSRVMFETRRGVRHGRVVKIVPDSVPGFAPTYIVQPDPDGRPGSGGLLAVAAHEVISTIDLTER